MMEYAFAARMLAGLAVVVVTLYGLQLVARARLRPGANGRATARLIEIVESAALPGAASLHVVRIAGRYHAIGRSGTSFTLLSEVESDAVDTWRAARAGQSLHVPALSGVLARLRGAPQRGGS